MNLSEKVHPLDSLDIRAACLVTVERNRALGSGWHSPCGGWLRLDAAWRFLGLTNTFYAGKPLLPAYREFGSGLYPGDPFYQARLYNRTDVYAYLLRNKFVSLRASLDFHVTPGSFIFYQKLTLKVCLDAANTGFPSRKKRHLPSVE